MDVSIFLARLIGLFMLIMGIAVFAREKKIKDIIIKLSGDSPLLFFMGTQTLILGLVAVLFHNIWVYDWRVIITILAWLTLLKGVIYTVFPEVIIQKINTIMERKSPFLYSGTFTLVVGLALSYKGFFG